MEELQKLYESKKNEIKNRLREFEEILKKDDERIFAEMVFCICTPQSKAQMCWNAVIALQKNNLLLEGNENQIRPFLNLVRFPENKTKFIVDTRKVFAEDGKINLKEKILSLEDNKKMREWLVKNVKGFGMKEASHFLRNIGLGKNLAILDRHILKNLQELGVIEKQLRVLNKKEYLEIEKMMKEFSEKIGIPMEELDLLLWSKETGVVFK